MHTRSRTKKNKPHAEGNKRKVLNAAFELFATKGYAQTSVDSIAAKAKTSKGLIYYYFKSKEDILNAIFATMLKESEIMFEGKDSLSPEKFMKQIVDCSFYFISHQTNQFRLMLALMAQPKVIKGLTKEIEQVRKQWMAEMAKPFKALGYKNPEMEVYLLCALFDGIALAYISMQDYPLTDIQQFVEAKYDL